MTEARDAGLPVYAETCPHYLFLTQEAYDHPGFESAKYVMTPPLRDLQHQQAIWRGLSTNDLQVVSTDHCPFVSTSSRSVSNTPNSRGETILARFPTVRRGLKRGCRSSTTGASDNGACHCTALWR